MRLPAVQHGRARRKAKTDEAHQDRRGAREQRQGPLPFRAHRPGHDHGGEELERGEEPAERENDGALMHHPPVTVGTCRRRRARQTRT